MADRVEALTQRRDLAAKVGSSSDLEPGLSNGGEEQLISLQETFEDGLASVAKVVVCYVAVLGSYVHGVRVVHVRAGGQDC